MDQEKGKLRTSKEVYDRIRWDPAFSAEDYVVGYEERFAGICEIHLTEFDPGGEIPWHRVQYIRGPEGIVWDRGERIDRIFGSGLEVSSLERAVSARTRTPSDELKSRREEALAVIETQCRALDKTARCHVTGSCLLGVDNAASDLDVLCATSDDIDHEALSTGLVKLLGRDGHLERARVVHAAIVPVLELCVDGVDIDLCHVICPEGTLPDEVHQLSTGALRRFDPISCRTVLGLKDTMAILEAAAKGSGVGPFRELAKAVRAWSRARVIDTHAYGFLGGFSWSLLAAWSCQSRDEDGEPSSEEQRLVRFFERVSRWPWPEPVGLSSAAQQYCPSGELDLMPIVTSTQPVTNSARAVTASTFEVLVAELDRARQISAACLDGRAEWDRLFEEVDLASSYPEAVTFEVTARDEAGRVACLGWLRQHIVSLVRELEEELDLRLRPDPRGPSLHLRSERTATLETELASSLDDFVGRFERWVARPPRSTLKWGTSRG